MEDLLRQTIANALQALELPAVDFVVEHPAEFSHGDYATNVALVAAKQAGESPRVIAEKLHAVLRESLEQIEKIEVAGPGFINFYLERAFFTTQTETVLQSAGDWGKNDEYAKEVVLFEYTSPNLFKPLHIGNLVGNIIGESVSRLYEYSGADVRRCNYPSDIGLTVAKGVWGLQQTGADPADIDAIGEAYRAGNAAYESGEAKEAIEAINRHLYAADDPKLNALREAGIATSRQQLEKLCALLGTHFDTEITESHASDPGLAIVLKHIGGVFTESDGAVVFTGEDVGLHTRVFINSQGLPTYEAKDIGHHMLKTAAHPDWTHSVIVTGSEQREYFRVLYAALAALHPDIRTKAA